MKDKPTLEDLLSQEEIEQWGGTLAIAAPKILKHANELKDLSPYTRDRLFHHCTLRKDDATSEITSLGIDGAFAAHLPRYLPHFIRAEEELLSHLVTDVGTLQQGQLSSTEKQRVEEALDLVGFMLVDRGFEMQEVQRNTEQFFSSAQDVFADPAAKDVFFTVSGAISKPGGYYLSLYNNIREALVASQLGTQDKREVLHAVAFSIKGETSSIRLTTGDPHACIPGNIGRLEHTLSRNQCVTSKDITQAMQFIIPGYRLVKKIGEGGSRKVYLADRVIGERVSRVPRKIKIFKADKDELHAQVAAMRDRRDIVDVMFYECDVLATISHPNLIRYFEHGVCEDLHYDNPNSGFLNTETKKLTSRMQRHFEKGGTLLGWFLANDKGKKTFFTVSQYIEGSSLDERLGDISYFNAGYLFRCIAQGLAYLHDKGFLHRDLKLRNILVNQDFSEVVIDDLETATAIGDLIKQPERVTIGSEYYAAPELIQGAQASVASDIYALGACFYYMLTGETTSLVHLTSLPEEAYNLRLKQLLEDAITQQEKAWEDLDKNEKNRLRRTDDVTINVIGKPELNPSFPQQPSPTLTEALKGAESGRFGTEHYALAQIAGGRKHVMQTISYTALLFGCLAYKPEDRFNSVQHILNREEETRIGLYVHQQDL